MVGEGMLIYILHNDKFYTFRLPKNVFGDYVLHDFDSNDFKRNLVNVSSIDGSWYINSNMNVKIMVNNQFVENCKLENYSYYMLVTNQNERILVYCMPGYDNSYVAKNINADGTIIVGRNNACDVVFNSLNISDKQLELTYGNNKWYVKNLNDNIPLYKNGIRVVEEAIDDFDSLFIMGLKISFCSKTIFINDSLNNLTISSRLLVDTIDQLIVNDYDSSGQVYKDFYNSSDYFSKSPVFLKKITPLRLTITPPDPKERADDSSLMMSIVPSALMSLTSVMSAYFSISNYNKGTTDKESLVTTVIMCVVMLFVSIVWPFVERFAEKIRSIVKEHVRKRVYRKYLHKKEEVLKGASNEQKLALVFNNLSLPECQEIIKKRNANLYSLNNEQDQFLKVRLGVGKVRLESEIDYQRPDFVKDKDNLLNAIDMLLEKYKYIDDAPYVFCLKNSIAFINSKGEFDKYLDAILLQLITFHDFNNLKLVVFTSENSRLNKIRNINHCFSEDRSVRYFATSMQDAETLSSQMIRVFNNRVESNESNTKSPFYLIISDDIDRFKNLKIMDKVLHEKKGQVGFSVLAFCNKLTDIPDGCNYFVEYDNKEATLFQSEMEEKNITKFRPEFITPEIDFYDCVNIIANIPIKVNNEASQLLPETYGFLEMYNVGNVNQLNSISRWKNSQITNSLTAPLGIDASNNVLNLDLHEKKHGPHGLIAGMTGSGKSELIISYVLSMSVNYSPNEVQFVLIDYKGGGLAGAFENRKTGMKLPHLVGTITNLDIASMNRTLVSIKSELQRRQKVFNEAKERLNSGVLDIYKYQKLVREGAIEEPMSHLFIICDEFAELKAQQPDFMDELVSAARIGRSLGIHLILATQKPSGVVDDQIWSNAKFKICCRVQTAEDSKEMIRRDDAAYIKESGRFYLQVGYDEIFVKAQSAYSGVPYVPLNTVNLNKSEKDSISFVDDLGNVVKSTRKVKTEILEKEDLGDELNNVLKYLIGCANELKIKTNNLWLDSISDHIYLYDLLKKYPVKAKKYIINVLVGEYDDPANQRQGPVFINITEKGNLWISGMFGSGKTTLMATTIYSAIVNHTSEEVNIFIVDLLSDSLKIFTKAQQVADYVSSADHDKLNKLFHYLEHEVTRRKKYFAESGEVFLNQAKKGEAPFPNLLVFLNGMDVFMDQYDDLFNDTFSQIVRDCNRVGIYFIITSVGYISSAVESSFGQKIAMRYSDNSEYQTIFNDTRGIIPATNPGRGLVELDVVYEFQTALIFDEARYEYNLNYVFNKLASMLTKANGLPIMPRVVNYDSVRDEVVTIDSVPIGIELSSNCTFSYDFSSLINIVVASGDKLNVSFMGALIKVMKRLDNTKIIVLDALDFADKIDDVQIYNSNFKGLCSALLKNIKEKKTNDPTAERIVFMISGYKKIQSHLKELKEEDSEVVTIDDLIIASIGAENYKFIIFNNSQLTTIDNCEWADYLDGGNGIILGLDPEEQHLIDFETSYEEMKFAKDTAIVVVDGRKKNIKYIRNRSRV